MRKEIIFAIVAGGGLGLVIAFGIWKTNIFLSRNGGNSSQTSSATPSPVFSEFKVVLAKPFDLAVLTASPATITGVTKPNAYVVISGENDDNMITASPSGTFEFKNLDLEAGANQVKVTGFDNDGNEANTSVLVVYSNQYTAPSATEAASARAYIGTVTDISSSVIQIKTDGGNIEQISGTSDAAYIDTRNDNTKQIKATDVAIGDYLVALGTKDTNNILVSSRVLVTDPIKKTTRTSFFGSVTDTKTGEITIKNNLSGKVVTVSPTSSIQINGASRFSSIKKENKVIVSGEMKDNNIEARTIYVLTSSK